MTVYSIDTSAWHHSTHPEVAARWREHLEADELDYDRVAQITGQAVSWIAPRGSL